MKKDLSNAPASPVLEVERAFGEYASDPIVLQGKGENTGWLLWVSPHAARRSVKRLHPPLPEEFSHRLEALKAARIFLDTALCRLLDHVRGAVLLWSTDKYLKDVEEDPEACVRPPEGAQMRECIERWKSLGCPEPCLIEGVSFLYEGKEYVQTLEPPQSVKPQGFDAACYNELMIQLFHASIQYNAVCAALFAKGWLLYEGHFLNETIHMTELTPQNLVRVDL